MLGSLRHKSVYRSLQKERREGRVAASFPRILFSLITIMRVDMRVQGTKLTKGSIRSVLSRHRASIARIVLHLLVQYRVLRFNRTHFITRSERVLDFLLALGRAVLKACV